jgi:hypothetical protein
MYLFGRRARLAGGKIRESMAWATGIAEKVTQISGTPVGVWSQVYSPEVGEIVWVTFMPDLSALEAFSDKCLVDDGYIAEVERGAQFILPGSVGDVLQVILHGEPDPNREVNYTAVVRTTISGGIANGTTLGIEIAQKAEALTGTPTAFLADATGNFGGVSWITAYASIEEVERAQMTINTDPGFVELLDSRAATAYADVPGASTQTLYRRIA